MSTKRTDQADLRIDGFPVDLRIAAKVHAAKRRETLKKFVIRAIGEQLKREQKGQRWPQAAHDAKKLDSDAILQ